MLALHIIGLVIPPYIIDSLVDSPEIVGRSIILLLNLFVYQQNCLDIQICLAFRKYLCHLRLPAARLHAV